MIEDLTLSIRRYGVCAAKHNWRGGVAIASFCVGASASGSAAWAAGVRTPSLIGVSAAAGAALLAASMVLPAYTTRRERQKSLEQALAMTVRPLPRSEAPLVAGAWADASPAKLLRAETQAVPFVGRTLELRRLASWVSSGRHGRIRLITGAGGIGKTRLAVEFARQLQEKERWRDLGWRCGTLRDNAGSAAIRAIAGASQPTLLVVDYAEGRIENDLIPILEALEEHNDRPVIRVLLLARSRGEWWDSGGRLRESASARSLIEEADEPVPLEPLDYTPQDMFRTALKRFSLGYDIPPPPTHLKPAQGATSILMAHAAALVAVLNAVDGIYLEEIVPDDRIVGELLNHESKYWNRKAKGAQLDKAYPKLGDSLWRRIVAFTGLVGASNLNEAMDTLHRLPELAGESIMAVERIADWLYGLYPAEQGSSALGSLQPDLLLEWLVTNEIKLDRPPNNYLKNLPDNQALHALEVVTRALDHYPQKSAILLEELLIDNIQTLFWPAVLRARDVGDEKFGKIVARVIANDFVPSHLLVVLC